MPKVVLEGYILVSDSDLPSVEKELPNHIRLTREEEGCLAFDVLQDVVNANRFSVYEEFSSRSSFEYHQQRVHSSNWGRLSRDVERHYQITEA